MDNSYARSWRFQVVPIKAFIINILSRYYGMYHYTVQQPGIYATLYSNRSPKKTQKSLLHGR
jgi:hypothetical protein